MFNNTTIFSNNYRLLEILLGDLTNLPDSNVSKVEGFMDLYFDALSKDSKVSIIALSHRYIQNGDSMADPDMEIAINHKLHLIEALTYRQDGLGIYQSVYDTFPNPQTVNGFLKKELNIFLHQWLNNIIDQRHSLLPVSNIL